MDIYSNDSIRTANYTGNDQRMMEGKEHLLLDGRELPYAMIDFWRWAYSELLRNTQRGVLAEYIVKSALECHGICTNEDIRSNFEPYDLIGPLIKRRRIDVVNNCTEVIESKPCRIEVKSAAYIQSWEPRSNKEPRISFSIAPARVPDETGDYKDDAPMQRNSDVYIFAIYKARSKEENILGMNLWEFCIVKTSLLNEKFGNQKNITLSKIVENSEGGTLRFEEVGKVLERVCEEISND